MTAVGRGWTCGPGRGVRSAVDERFRVFGSSGRLLVTVVGGLALRRLLAAPGERAERSGLAGTAAAGA